MEDIDLQEEIEKQDVIFLMITERFLFKFGWNFIENVYNLYGPTSKYDKIHDYKCKIWNYNVWFTNIIEDAKKRNISLEKMIGLAAEYTYSQDNLENLLMYKGPEYYTGMITNDYNRYNKLQAEAKETNIPIEDLVKQEAIKSFEKHPEVLTKYNELQSAKQKIRNDSMLFLEVQKFAAKYYLTIEESVQIIAEEKYESPFPD